jgi:DNA-binding SARP family transcriptional activator/pimeloyl-ACP methyl ester carboxylesterase
MSHVTFVIAASSGSVGVIREKVGAVPPSSTSQLQFRLLGPLEAREGDRAIALGGAKQRALLTLLLLDARRVVSTERLVDELWGDGAPESARKMVQIHVSSLRKVLPNGLLRTWPSGYSMDVDAHATDLGRFERLAAEGRGALAAGDPDAAAAMLSSALALWRGQALEEFAEPFAVRERARLESLRLAALEDRIEAELARGAHADMTAELDALVLEHPQRERLRGQHMLALYRSGREAEALASYQAAWQHLDKELGIQPSRALRALEQRILAQDPTLVAEPAAPAAPVEDRSVRYAVNGGVSLAYQVYGSGRAEIVLVAGWVLPMELFRDDPGFAAFLDRLGEAARVLVWDKRGTGLSDRVSPASLPTLEERMGDLRAVMDAAGFARPAIVGLSEGTHLALMLAATHPERVRALALYGGWACSRRSADYPWGATQEEDDKLVQLVREHWGDAAHLLRIWAPESQHDPALRAWWARALRLGATPTAAEIWLRMMEEIDLRAVLPSIRVPTVVIHRRGDVIIPVGNGRYLGEAIPGAQYVELPGADHLWWVGDRDAILDPIVDLVDDVADEAVPERVLATILAIRTPVGVEAEVRAQVERHGGRLLGGDLAAFDGPTRAVRCTEALRTAFATTGRELHAGLHIGECDRHGDRLSGPAIDVARQLGLLAGRHEILVSRTVVDLVAGSGLQFDATNVPFDGPTGPIEVSSLAAPRS